jgi:hypothetical protein
MEMEIPTRAPASECIWCGREFSLSGFSAENDIKLGRVKRSKEHLIPQSILGSVWTNDVCKGCNDRLGSGVDHFLLRDGVLIEAAQRAGIYLPELLSDFRVTQKDEDGGDVPVRVKSQNFRSEPSFAGGNIRIPGDETGWTKRDEQHAKAVLFGKIKKDLRVDLSNEEIRREIDAMFESFRTNPNRSIFNPAIHQGLRRIALDSKCVVSWSYNPWETEWAISKMAFEIGRLTWPAPYLRYLSPILSAFKDLITNRSPGIGIFEKSVCDNQGVSDHSIECILMPDRFFLRITLFGSANWVFQSHLGKNKNAPRTKHRICLVNPVSPTNTAPPAISESEEF